MKPKLYVETTIVSYLTSRLSRDLIVAAHQQLTQQWWDAHRDDFELFTSQIAVQEAGVGDEEAARRRLMVLEELPVLALDERARELARRLVAGGIVPAEATEDALHIAVATVHGMQYLLTWNCAHIANARMRYLVEETCRASSCEPPIICTPEELMES